jgi:hypothetical protein
MTNITISESFEPQLSDKDLVDVEQQLGITLPLDYKGFLLAHNGGQPHPNRFPIAGNSSDTHALLGLLFGICKDKWGNLVDQVRESRDRMPPEFIPIGLDPGGNLILLAVSGPNKDKVYFWTHEEEADEGEPPTYDNLYFIANSFTEMLDSLTTLP